MDQRNQEVLRTGGEVMAYVNPNFKTKKTLIEHLKAGKGIDVYEPGLGQVPHNGTVSLEGPHYPEPHRWYGIGTMVDDMLIKVK